MAIPTYVLHDVIKNAEYIIDEGLGGGVLSKQIFYSYLVLRFVEHGCGNPTSNNLKKLIRGSK